MINLTPLNQRDTRIGLKILVNTLVAKPNGRHVNWKITPFQTKCRYFLCGEKIGTLK